jgi:hypothetical protein
MESIHEELGPFFNYDSKNISGANFSKTKAAFDTPHARIRRACMRDPIALAVLRYFAELGESELSIDVDSLVSQAPDVENARQRVIQFLKQLEEEKLGTFTIGRRGRKSRFETPRGLRALAQLFDPTTHIEHALNEQAEPTKASTGDNSEHGARTKSVNEADIKTLTHRYILRPNYSFSIVLPVDLTETEASRLSEFIKSLPFQ